MMGSPRLNCPLCASMEAAPFLRKVPDFEYGTSLGVDFLRCGKCGLVFQDPMPEPRDLAGFYPEGYRNHIPVGKDLWSRLKKLQVERLAETLAGHIPDGGRVLEVGCGNGQLLFALKEIKAGAYYGSDASGAAFPDPKDSGIRFKSCDIEEAFPFELIFDVIVMNNAVEHFSSPLRALQACRKRLAPSGKIILITPNSGALEFPLFGRHWAGLHAPRHTHVFNRENIRRLGANAGLTDVQVYPAADPGQWALSVQNRLQDCAATRARLTNGMAWYASALTALFAPVAFLQNRSRGSNAMLCVLSRFGPLP